MHLPCRKSQLDSISPSINLEHPCAVKCKKWNTFLTVWMKWSLTANGIIILFLSRWTLDHMINNLFYFLALPTTIHSVFQKWCMTVRKTFEVYCVDEKSSWLFFLKEYWFYCSKRIISCCKYMMNHYYFHTVTEYWKDAMFIQFNVLFVQISKSFRMQSCWAESENNPTKYCE